MYCFFYDSATNAPRIVIGPDYMYSIVEAVLANAITICVGIVPSYARGFTPMLIIGISLLVCQNIAFALTFSLNPGLPPRNINNHSKTYLNRIKTVETHRYCTRCQIVARKDVETEHCSYCNYCVERVDHHCPWSSKCIAKRNMIPFKFFIALTCCLVIYSVMALVFAVGIRA